MAAIIWDQQGQRKFEYGVCRAVLYVHNPHPIMNDPIVSGFGTYWDCYNRGVAWNGIISVSENASGGDSNDIYAGNILYASIQSVNKYEGTIEAYTYPEEFTECDGSKQMRSGVYFNQQKGKRFGLVYTTYIGSDIPRNDSLDYKLHIIYNAIAQPSDKQYESINDTSEPITMSWDLTSIPIETNSGERLSSVTIDVSKIDQSKLQNFLNILKLLFGTDDIPPILISPSEILYYLDNGVPSAFLAGLLPEVGVAPVQTADKFY